MPITEDMSLFLADFGETAVFGAVEAYVLLDRPDVDVLDGVAVANDPFITYSSLDLTALARGSTLTIGGVGYKVREIRKLDDGALSRAVLERT